MLEALSTSPLYIHILLGWPRRLLCPEQKDYSLLFLLSVRLFGMTRIARSAADPELNLLARGLRDLVWLTTLDQDELNEAQEMGANVDARRRHVYPLPDYKSWAVRTYLGGANRTIGVYKPRLASEIWPALRFADMAAMYFWQHKVRGAHEPGDMELNFSVDRAKTDLEMEDHAVALLRRIEAHLVEIGAIVSSEEIQHQRTMRKELWRKQRTVSNTVLEVCEVLETAMQRLEKGLSGQMEANTKEIARLNSVIELLLTRLPAGQLNTITVTPWQSQGAPSPTNLPPEYQPPLVTYGIPPQTVALPPQNIFPQTTCGDGSGPAPL